MASLSPEERTALRDGFARLLADRCTEKDVRRTMETASGYDPALWGQIAAMGVTGLLVDEAHGGAGAGPLELEAVMEAAGAALLGSPLLSSAVLAATLLAAAGDEAAKARLLPGIADGSLIATLALTGDAGTWTPEGMAVTAAPAGNGWTLDGHASFVTDGQTADRVLVAANGPGGLALFEVEREASGLDTAALPTFDHTLRMARLTFDKVAAQKLDATGPAWDAVQAALNMGLVALAGEQAGGARRVLEMTVDYAKSRIQFGRPIGSFQAIKHMAADLLLESESATSAARNAARALAENAPDAKAAIALAAFACADAYATTTATAIQMHGGIAFTWDHPAHLYLRRARAGAQLFGNSNHYRERYLQALEAQA
ncbi:alkylation response protein AidB-like acyl-CoA dehydrogenase [Caulobacter ginsengisoli]|uniref:Alkylation response protein AidB-like acyl-CoA dehydrogenase n=1 Tax=Caulobacter ginsengisoli TaxID=400775 RepID=A0ABU0IXK0_9CAUL|nr:acyl-CoA dehydrogenase family protein [Caulobacter ginsengisoli]MDQ0466733.1 alkylation response protein AidB-like acyl-CoA dehydrogenase [Caulobacter ginsengisoli]